ncbi:MAG: hypothetical protein MJ252_14620 [archaeon]|nr:hypothetical protein [archaeon]
MEDYTEIESNMKYFLKESDEYFSEENFHFEINKIPSLSNNDYHIKLIQNNINQISKEFLYKKYGEISECIDHEIEEEIIAHLSKDEMAPKILYSDPEKKYRIEEFINTEEEGDDDGKDTDIDNEEDNSNTFQSDLLDQIIQICLSYSLISKIYMYRMKSNDELFQKYNIVIDMDDSNNPEINKKSQKRRGRIRSKKKIKNFYDFVVDDIYSKAMLIFNEFVSKAQKKFTPDSNKELFDDILKLKIYLTNFRSLVEEVFPKKGCLTLNHNSIRDKNLLKKKQFEKFKKKLMIIDHEFASLNLVGYDIVNYMNEQLFEYLPKYKFKGENYDFNYFYSIFQRYMDRFKKESPEIGQTMNNTIYNLDDSEKYFTQLFCLNHLFWMAYSCIYLNFENYIKGQGFNFLQHAIDRAKCFEKGLGKLNEIEEEEEDGIVLYI